MAASDGETVFDGKEALKFFRKAASGTTVRFAFGMASKVEDCVLLLDLRKQVNALKQEVKALPQVTKVCAGVVTVVDKDVRFQPQKPIQKMSAMLRRMFKSEGLGVWKPSILDDQGQELDDGAVIETEDDDSAEPGTGAAAEPATAGGGETQPDPELAELKRRLAAAIGRLEDLPGDQATKLKGACAAVVKLLQKPDFDGAAQGLTQIEAILDRQRSSGAGSKPGATPQGGDLDPDRKARLTEALTRLVAEVKALPKSDAAAQLGLQARDAARLIGEGDEPGAAAALRGLQTGLAALRAGAPARRVPGATLLKTWRDAKESTDAAVAALGRQLRSYGHADLDRIAEMGLNGITEGNSVGILRALMDYSGAPDVKLDAAAKALLAQIDAYRSFLERSAEVRMCENNPFGIAVNLRGPLGAALDDIQNALAA